MSSKVFKNTPNSGRRLLLMTGAVLMVLVAVYVPSAFGDSGIDIITVGPITARAGETVTYSYTIINNSDTALHDIAVTDTLFGSNWSKALGSLAANDAVSFTLDYRISSGDPNPLNNTSSVSALTTANAKITAKTTWSVDIMPTVVRTTTTTIKPAPKPTTTIKPTTTTTIKPVSKPTTTTTIKPAIKPTTTTTTIKPLTTPTTKRKPTYTLAVKNAVNKKSVKANDQLTYSITVTNTGTGRLTNVTISDTIPTYTAYVTKSASKGAKLTNKGKTFVLTLAGLDAGKKAVLSFKVKVRAFAKTDIRNMVQVKASEIAKPSSSQIVTKLVFPKTKTNPVNKTKVTIPKLTPQGRNSDLVYYRVLPYDF